MQPAGPAGLPAGLSRDGSLQGVSPGVSQPAAPSTNDCLCTLYFGNLHPFVAVSSLHDLCNYFGPVEQVKIIKEKNTGTSAGYGFVRFRERSAADNALNMLNGKNFLGQELRVNWAFQTHQKEDTSTHFHIFVGDLGQDVTDALLYNHFCVAASCSEARVMWDQSTGRSKGYGFVSFRNKEDADMAIARMHGQYVGSRRVRCGPAQHKQEGAVQPLNVASVDSADTTNTNVYVGNVPLFWTDADVTQTFQQFGTLAEVRLHKKGGYGFICFERHEDAVTAIVNINGKQVGDKVLKCSWGKNPATAAAAAAGGGPPNAFLGANHPGAAFAQMPGSPYIGGMQHMAAIMGGGGGLGGGVGLPPGLMSPGGAPGGMMHHAHHHHTAHHHHASLPLSQMITLQQLNSTVGMMAPHHLMGVAGSSASAPVGGLHGEPPHGLGYPAGLYYHR